MYMVRVVGLETIMGYGKWLETATFFIYVQKRVQKWKIMRKRNPLMIVCCR